MHSRMGGVSGIGVGKAMQRSEFCGAVGRDAAGLSSGPIRVFARSARAASTFCPDLCPHLLSGQYTAAWNTGTSSSQKTHTAEPFAEREDL